MNQDLLQKLVRLANNNPNENEANLAARRVCKMLAESWDVKPKSQSNHITPDWFREEVQKAQKRADEEKRREDEESYQRMKEQNPSKSGEYKTVFDSSSFTQERDKYTEDFIAEMFRAKGKGK